MLQSYYICIYTIIYCTLHGHDQRVLLHILRCLAIFAQVSCIAENIALLAKNTASLDPEVPFFSITGEELKVNCFSSERILNAVSRPRPILLKFSPIMYSSIAQKVTHYVTQEILDVICVECFIRVCIIM